MGLGSSLTANADHAPMESHVKAAILYNLARFSEWHEDHVLSETSFNVCTLSEVDMEHALDALKGKTIHERSLDVTHLDNEEDITSDCQVLYVSSTYIEEHDDIEMLDLSKIAQKGILTVGETPDFIEFGGCITIQRFGKKLRFSISQSAMDSANIKPSSKILKLSVDPNGKG